MPSFSYGVGSHGVTIPANAYSISIQIAGGSGGGGGSDAGASARPGGQGRLATISLPQFTPRSLTIAVGSQGGNGNGCVGGGGRGASGFGGSAVGGCCASPVAASGSGLDGF